MATIYVEYDDGRTERLEVGQFLIAHVKSSKNKECLQLIVQCQNDFLDAVLNEKVKEDIKKAVKYKESGK